MSFNPCFFASALVSVQTVQQSLYCLFFFFLRDFSTTHFFRFLEVLDYHTPFSSFVHLLSTFLSSFFVFIHKRPPAISIPAHTIFFAPVTPPSVTEFARSVCFSVSSVSGCGYHSSSAWLCHILRVCHSIILSASSVCPSLLVNFFQPVQSVCLSNLQLAKAALLQTYILANPSHAENAATAWRTLHSMNHHRQAIARHLQHLHPEDFT